MALRKLLQAKLRLLAKVVEAACSMDSSTNYIWSDKIVLEQVRKQKIKQTYKANNYLQASSNKAKIGLLSDE